MNVFDAFRGAAIREIFEIFNDNCSRQALMYFPKSFILLMLVYEVFCIPLLILNKWKYTKFIMVT